LSLSSKKMRIAPENHSALQRHHFLQHPIWGPASLKLDGSSVSRIFQLRHAAG
jgi:hypothetical protein